MRLLKLKIYPVIAAVLLLNLVVACSNQSLQDYAKTTPNLKLETFFNGELIAYGMVFDRSGKMTRRFEVELLAEWYGNQGEIKEWFEFDDGEKSTRIWQLEKLSENKYKGTANDVVGVAYGETKGSALYWSYDLLINYDGSEYQVRLDDWMYLMDEKRLFNRTEIVKFGIKLGEVILYIEQK